MHWFRELWHALFGNTPAAARRLVNRRDRDLAKLRAHIQSLPPEERGDYDYEVRAALRDQAAARNTLDDAMDNRYKR